MALRAFLNPLQINDDGVNCLNSIFKPSSAVRRVSESLALMPPHVEKPFFPERV
jgi:hypothetical protein